MPEMEKEAASSKNERVATPLEVQRARHLVAEQAVRSFTFLGEIETAYDFERDFLREHIIGQSDAIEAIVAALDRKEVRRDDDNRPIANLAFLGPTGVGKTETAKALSQVLNPSAPNLLRIDCSNFSNGHEIAALLGAPPGYTGRDQKPILSADRVESDGTVILFDEIEKGSPQLNNLLLQIMDNGELELNNDTTVSFRNSILIMTSNLGAKEMDRQARGSKTGFITEAPEIDKEGVESVALKTFKEFFSPEFVNRLDNLVVFHSLDEDSLYKVLDAKLNSMNDSYVDTFGAFITLSGATKEYIVQQAMLQSAYGARPLVRALEKSIASHFGRYVASEKIPNGSEVYVYHRDEVNEHVHESYKHDLVFAIRPDENVKIPPESPEPTGTGIVFRPGVTSTGIVHRSPENQ